MKEEKKKTKPTQLVIDSNSSSMLLGPAGWVQSECWHPCTAPGGGRAIEPPCSSQGASLTHLQNDFYNTPFSLFALSHLAKEKTSARFLPWQCPTALLPYKHNTELKMFLPASSTEASMGAVSQPILSSEGDAHPLRNASEMPISITRSALKSLLPQHRCWEGLRFSNLQHRANQVGLS